MDKNQKEINFEKIEKQLLLLKQKKKKLIHDIYILYEIYLKGIRKEFSNSVEKGIFSLITLNKTNNLNQEDVLSFLNDKVNLLINDLLPFLTIEQLSINDFEYKNTNEDELKIEENIIFESQHSDHENISLIEISPYDSYGYHLYESKNLVDLKSSEEMYNYDLGIYSNDKELPSNKIETNDQLVQSLLDSQKIEVIEKISDNKKQQTNQFLFNSKNIIDILNWSNSLDSNLAMKINKLSYLINIELFKKKLVNTLISEEAFLYLCENSFLVSNPQPFIMLFDSFANEIVIFDKYTKELESQKLYFFNLNPMEIEFYNINLSIFRNKISKLRDEIKSLIKKEKYWKNKKLSSIFKSSVNNKG